MALRILGWFGINGGKILAGERTSDHMPVPGATLFDIDGVPYSVSNPLPTNASLSGDVQIGAVEIKNDSDDTRAKVGSGTAANALRVVIATDDPTQKAVAGAGVISPSDTVAVTAGRQLLINCTVAGNVKVKFSDGSVLVIPVQVGLTILPWAVVQVFVTLTTATATYYNLV